MIFWLVALGVILTIALYPRTAHEQEIVDVGTTDSVAYLKAPNPTNLKTEKEEIIDYIRLKFGEDSDMALKVFTCESGLRPSAINWGDAKITGMPSQGIAQINAPYNDDLFDWKYNIDIAYEMYSRRNWQPWSCFKLINR